jgi:rubredoxin
MITISCCSCGKMVHAEDGWTPKKLAGSEQWTHLGRSKWVCRDCNKKQEGVLKSSWDGLVSRLPWNR